MKVLLLIIIKVEKWNWKQYFLLLYRFVNSIKWNNWLNNFFYMAKRVNFSQLMMRLMLPFLSLMNDFFFTLFFFIILYVHWILHFNWFSFTSFNGKIEEISIFRLIRFLYFYITFNQILTAFVIILAFNLSFKLNFNALKNVS